MTDTIIRALVEGIGLTQAQATILATDNADRLAALPATRNLQAVGYIQPSGASDVVLLDGDATLCDLKVRAGLLSH